MPGKPKIDPEFAKLIPPPSDEELANLESSLLKDGCLDTLKVWKGHNILLDGHNRLKICTKYKLKYAVEQIDKLPDRDAAADWIDANQLSRRNLTPDAFRLLTGRRYIRLKRQDGGHGDQKSESQKGSPIKTAVRLAKEHGVSKNTIMRNAKFAEQVEADPDLQKAVRDRVPVQQVVREKREKKRDAARRKNAEKAKAVADPLKAGAKFTTILIDPPWDWGDEGDVNQMGRAKPDYATMPISEMMKLPIDKLAADDAHVYMWITNRSMPKGFGLLEAWGFRYITLLTWPKPSFGMGNYFRGQTEHVMFGVKGSLMLKRKDASTLLPSWKRGPGGHSSKPSEMYAFIESCSPGPCLELFSRTKREGWSAWGADA